MSEQMLTITIFIPLKVCQKHIKIRNMFYQHYREKKRQTKIYFMPKTSNDHFSSTVYKMKNNSKLVTMRIFDLYITLFGG